MPASRRPRAAAQNSRQFAATPAPTEADLTFHGYVPWGSEVLMHGGLPGVEYLWVAPISQPSIEALPPTEADGYQWRQLRDFLWPISIEGPKGKVAGVKLYGRGAPIRGASPHGGHRRWYVDNAILDATGIIFKGATPAKPAQPKSSPTAAAHAPA